MTTNKRIIYLDVVVVLEDDALEQKKHSLVDPVRTDLSQLSQSEDLSADQILIHLTP